MTILTSGTALAQSLTVLTLPLLTRLYTPHDFNVLAVYVGLLSVVTVVSSLRYNIAIPLPERDEDGASLLCVSLIAASTLSLLCAVPTVLFSGPTAEILGQPDLESNLWMIPLGILAASAYNALQYWASRKKRFSLISKTRVVRAIGGVGSQLGLGIAKAGSAGLIFGHMIYSGLGIVALLRSAYQEDRALLRQVSVTNLLKMSKRYRRFPMYSVPDALLNTASVHLPLIMIAAMLTGPEAGFLFLAMRIMGAPVDLIGSSISQVFLAEAPARQRAGTLEAFTLRTMRGLLKAGTPILLTIGVLCPFSFPLIFGPDWARAGWLVLWLTPWYILQFVVGPVSAVMQVQGRMGLALLVNTCGFCIRTIAVLIGVWLAPQYVAEIFSLAGTAFCVLYIAVVIFCVKRPPIAFQDSSRGT